MTSLITIAMNHPMQVTSINAASEVEQRLNALGLRKGQWVQVIRKAILGGPIHVRVGMTDLIIRRKDAACVYTEDTSVVNQLNLSESTHV